MFYTQDLFYETSKPNRLEFIEAPRKPLDLDFISGENAISDDVFAGNLFRAVAQRTRPTHSHTVPLGVFTLAGVTLTKPLRLACHSFRIWYLPPTHSQVYSHINCRGRITFS